MQLKLKGVGGSHSTVLTGSRVRIRGIVSVFVADQRVTVRVFRNGRKVLARRVAVAPHPTGSGRFELTYRMRRVGRVVVRAVHRPTPALDALAAVARSVDVLPRQVGPGSTRGAVRSRSLPRGPRVRPTDPRGPDVPRHADGCELLEAVELLRKLNRRGVRRVPDTAPTGFVPRGWRPFVRPPGGGIDRHHWELCVLSGP